MNRFVISDIHGNYLKLKQCLKLVSFDYHKDKLICLGDTADGEDVKDCFDELLKIKNLVYILGNHDNWLLEYFITGKKPPVWLVQGGNKTLHSYPDQVPDKNHIDLLKNALLYYIEDDMMFVHGGFNPYQPIEKQGTDILTWDRGLVEFARKHETDVEKLLPYKRIFTGHTPTVLEPFCSDKPLFYGHVIMADTGASFGCCLSIINIDTLQVYQSQGYSRNEISWIV